MLYALFLYVNAQKDFISGGARCKNHIKCHITNGLHLV
jgi:hypothetical protein